MHKKLVSIICLVSTLVLITVYLGVTPAWSAPGGKKPAIHKPIDKGIQEPGDLKDGNKGEKPVKKKAVKKAGTAVAVGVAGAKVQSGLKGKGTKDKE